MTRQGDVVHYLAFVRQRHTVQCSYCKAYDKSTTISRHAKMLYTCWCATASPRHVEA